MAKLNIPPTAQFTHEGATAKRISNEMLLRRSVMSCFLWEKEFYEDGQQIADRIVDLVSKVDEATSSAIAIEARKIHNLRHVPLLICAAMAKHKSGSIVGKTIEEVISRADELAEFVAIA